MKRDAGGGKMCRAKFKVPGGEPPANISDALIKRLQLGKLAHLFVGARPGSCRWCHNSEHEQSAADRSASQRSYEQLSGLARQSDLLAIRNPGGNLGLCEYLLGPKLTGKNCAESRCPWVNGG